MCYRVFFSGCTGRVKDASSTPVRVVAVTLGLLPRSLGRTPRFIKAEYADCDASPGHLGTAPESLKSGGSLLTWATNVI